MTRTLLMGLAGLFVASAAMAEPQELSDGQMDEVAAGLFGDFHVLNNFSVFEGASLNFANVVPVAVSTNTAVPVAVGVFSQRPVSAGAFNNGFSGNLLGLSQ